MAIDGELFKRVLGSFASGVTVITTPGAGGKPVGMTVSAFSSVSLDPPLILVCIDLKAECHPALQAAERFAVNILSQTQLDISRRFATKGVDRFDGVPIRRGTTGMPLLEGAVSVLECRTVAAHPAGDHTIFVGEVEAAAVKTEPPLLYCSGRYGAFTPLA